MRRRRRGRLRLPNRGRDRAMAQPQRPALLLEAQAASARVACGGCCRNSSQRTGSAGGVRIQGWIEGVVVAYASCLSSGDRSGGYRPAGGWSGGRQERRDLESNAIEPLACFGSLLRGFWPQALDLARCGTPAAHFDLGCFKTRLRVARARGVLRALYLRRARLDTRFLGVGILSHVLRHAAFISAPCALLLGDGSGRVKV